MIKLAIYEYDLRHGVVSSVGGERVRIVPLAEIERITEAVPKSLRKRFVVEMGLTEVEVGYLDSMSGKKI